jgi:hypothetical protein
MRTRRPLRKRRRVISFYVNSLGQCSRTLDRVFYVTGAGIVICG